jgi:hypothetical protein
VILRMHLTKQNERAIYITRANVFDVSRALCAFRITGADNSPV